MFLSVHLPLKSLHFLSKPQIHSLHLFLHVIIQHIWRRCTLDWDTVKMASEQSELQWGTMREERIWNAFPHPPENGIQSDRRWRISNYSTGSPDMQREQPIKTWRRGLARSYTKTWKEMKKRKEQEREEDVETGVRCKDSQFACTSTPFLSLCTIWIREKSLNPGWLWTTKRSLNYTPNLQLYARTHSHQAHRGCDMRNQILKKGGTGASYEPDVYNILCLPY